MRYLIFAVVLFGLSACSILFPEDEYLLNVEPVKFVSCTESLAHNSPCGRVPVSQEQADGFMVTAGYKRFYGIVGPYQGAEQFRKQEINLFGDFAVKEIIARGYCAIAEVPDRWQHILRWEGRGERGIYVSCKEK